MAFVHFFVVEHTLPQFEQDILLTIRLTEQRRPVSIAIFVNQYIIMRFVEERPEQMLAV